MNREQRRHPPKTNEVKEILDNWSDIRGILKAQVDGWPLHEGDRVTLNLDVITKHPRYESKNPAYRKFCEENAGRVFTVEYCGVKNPSVVCLAEDTTHPKWLFWVGDLEKVEE